MQVEALKGFRVVDIACGSGDAQTLCITDDDSVWSWGDGDYGKLGRGGSDGCKVPMKIDALQGLGVCKVECGSQFSVALTKSGAVYTWQVLLFFPGYNTEVSGVERTRHKTTRLFLSHSAALYSLKYHFVTWCLCRVTK